MDDREKQYYTSDDEINEQSQDKPIVQELPSKPLVECGVDDLSGLSPKQLHELLVRESRYGRRTATAPDFDTRMTWEIHFQPQPPDYRGFVKVEEEVAPHISVATNPDERDKNDYQRVKIEMPYCGIGNSKAAFAHLQVLLEENNLPKISFLPKKKLIEASDLYNNPNLDLLRGHDYGDGRINCSFERLEELLAQEISDLKELGIDFDDVVSALEAIVGDAHYAVRLGLGGVVDTQEEVVGEDFPYGFAYDDQESYSHTVYRCSSKVNPGWNIESHQWRHNVLRLPFDIKASVIDHQLFKEDDPNVRLPISETSLELYKQRVVEGFYLGHYRISAARMVWVTEYGTQEQQMKAFELDWQNTKRALDMAHDQGTAGERASILRYISSFFPEDCSFWCESGFPGYSWTKADGEVIHFQTLNEWLQAAKEKFEELEDYEKTGMVKQSKSYW